MKSALKYAATSIQENERRARERALEQEETEEAIERNVDNHNRRVIAVVIKVLRVVLSNIAVFLTIIAYSALGGYVFEYLEIDNERKECIKRRNTFMPKRHEAIDRLVSISGQGLDINATTDSFEKILDIFSKDTLVIQYDWTNCNLIGREGGTEAQWSWVGSTMFAVTVITTVGT